MKAWDRIVVFIIIGIGLAILSGFLIGMNWPGTEVTKCFNEWSGEDCSETNDTGNMALVTIGFLLGGLSQILLLVGLVGWGVKLGTQAAANL